ncbi:MAG TPA: DinB family protein [Saprospiraceae bacterium]|nr:DinB family protein [Saprospiraceae bacterium]
MKTNREFHINFDNKQDHSIEYLLGILKDTRTTTIMTVRNFSANQLDWQYKEGWNTIGCLLLHISAIEHYFRIVYVEKRDLTEMENIELTPTLDMGGHIPSLIAGKEIDSYLNELTISRQKLLESFKQVNFETFSKIFQSKDYGSNSNLAWALFHMIEDEIYHRGQISMIKKLMTENK